MKKRLRKKRRVGEFQELGFEFNCRPIDGLTDDAFDQFLDAFIDQVENHHLLFGGGGDRTHWGGFVTSAKHRGSATEVDRTHVQEWLSCRPEVTGVTIGPLVDAWK